MIDIHCHILPGLDDGPATIDESLQMCRVAASDGIKQLVATPHIRRPTYDSTKADIIAATEALRTRISAEGLSLELCSAAVVRLEWNLFEQVMAGEIPMLGEAVQYLLLESPLELMPPGYAEFFHKLLLKGIVPIIAHPERVYELQGNLKPLHQLVNLGALVQVAAMSLTGEFGVKAEQTAKSMLKHRLVHLLATEAHSPVNRPPLFSPALDVASKIVGEEAAMNMVTETPARILRGEYVEPEEPLAPGKRWSFRWFGFSKE
jgi:protein-tyrosine phosphatase